ncbi:EutN/CcmL family microcompartment protein [Desulfovibrio sp. OttesenSCG-928-G15]|nr:EutN/CcmL family microcompartment protein [Desulfovibrio sp. OttesenSCG-928-G15]
MIIAMVIGNIWSTRKQDSLNGLKFMVVKPVPQDSDEAQDSFVAADCVGAGIGEKVLIATGSAARRALGEDNIPVDAAIIGIIDEAKADKD